MEDIATDAKRSDQSGPRQGLPAWLRPLQRFWSAMSGQPYVKEAEEMSDPGIRLTYDLKDTLTPNRFVGLWRMATGFRKIYLFAVAAAGLAALSRSAVFYLLRFFVDDVLTSADRQWQILWVAAGITVLALLQGLFSFGMGRLAAQTAEGVARRLRNYLYDHMQRLTFTYHDTTQTGELIQRATSDVDTLRRLFQDQLIGIGRTGLLFLVEYQRAGAVTRLAGSVVDSNAASRCRGLLLLFQANGDRFRVLSESGRGRLQSAAGEADRRARRESVRAPIL